MGFTPAAVDVIVPDSGANISVKLAAIPQSLATTVISETRLRLPRVFERKEKHLGHVLFAEDLPQYQVMNVSDLLQRVPRFYELLTATRSCRGATVFVDGLHLPPESELDEYVRPEEVAAIEVHSSADFIHEDFLTFPPDPPTPAPTKMLGPIRLGTPPPRVFQNLSGTCRRIVMVWTWWYRSRQK